MTAEWTNSLQGLGILAAALFTGWQAWQGRRQAKAAKGMAEAAAGAAGEAAKTLTTNNGGSHVKDALDRLEAGMADLRSDFRDHKTDAARWEARTDERIDRLERRRPRFPFL